MSVDLCAFERLPPERQESFAELISGYTKGYFGETPPQMIPVEPEAVLQKHLGVIALGDNETFRGYVGAKPLETHDNVVMSEVGTLLVPPEFQKKGYARLLVGRITAKLATDGVTPYAFCNPLSEGVFKRSGYKEVGPRAIPTAAFDACCWCPKWAADDGCCDKLLIFAEKV
ncbi:MAG TPA: GNAT family N-acetyltransferase [Patescibacteria group bacterium]|nr:GNAT family N-acetyltransferase [Patescibacteria group bacterium]